MYKLAFIGFFVICISLTPYAFSEEIPDWVKNNASWWSDRIISQSEFTNGLEFLINEGIIFIPEAEPALPGPDKTIPDWVRNTAGWWSDDLIPDSEFINAMKFLIEIGIIEVDAFSPEVVIPETTDIEEKTSPLNIVFEATQQVYTDGKLRLDVKIHDSENFSGNDYYFHRKGIDGVIVNLKIFDQEGVLIYDFDTETKYSGLAQFEVMAKETSSSRGGWSINNTYIAKISATLGEQSGENSFDFIILPEQSYQINNSGPSISSSAYALHKAQFVHKLTINTPVVTPEGLIFSPDGQTMFVTDNESGDAIEQYSLATPWEIRSATHVGKLDITDGSSDDIEDIAFNNLGTTMYVVERADDKVLEYSLSCAWDVVTSGCTVTDNNSDFAIPNDVTNNPEDIAFNKSGTIMYILDNDQQVAGDQVFQYHVPTAWDVSSITEDPASFTLDSTASGMNPDAFEFSEDGKFMFVADPEDDDAINKYALGTPGNVATAVLVYTFELSDEGDHGTETATKGLAFGDNGKQMYLTGTSDKVWHFDLTGVNRNYSPDD